VIIVRVGDAALQIIQDKFMYKSLVLFCICVGIVALLLLWSGFSNASAMGGEEYEVLARNLLAGHGFSGAEHPPFEPEIMRTPGYPVFLASIYLLAGHSYTAVRAVQVALLAGTSWLLFLMTTRLTNRKVALVAGLICASYQPFGIFALFHTSESLCMFLVVLSFYLIARITEQPRALAESLAAGATLGCAALVRPSVALLLLIPVVALLLHRGFDSRYKRKCYATLVGGYSIFVAPFVVRTLCISHSPVFLSSEAPQSLWTSAQQYSGAISYKLTVSEFQFFTMEYNRRRADARTLAQLQRKASVPLTVQTEILMENSFSADAKKTFATIPILRLIKNVPLRVYYLWGVGDISGSTGIYHKALQALHVFLALSVVGGVILSITSLKSHWLVWSLPAYLTGVHFVFHVDPRYSMPGRPFLFIYASLFLVFIWDFCSKLNSSFGNARNQAVDQKRAAGDL
jgi:4-amino-4-deoxy-L-arabinose transferase-like glycosyltransferase